MASSENPAPLIMLVDDFPSTLMILEHMLKRAGYEVRSFASGKDALDAMESISPNLILLDIHMPDMDGYEVCTRIKSNPALAEVPVLFLSAADEPMDKVKAFNCGASDYLTKPYHPAEILSRVGVYIAVQNLRRELETLSKTGEGSRLKELESLLGEFTRILIHEGQSPVSRLENHLGALKVSMEGRLTPSASADLDAAINESEALGRLFQKCLRTMSAQARARKS